MGKTASDDVTPTSWQSAPMERQPLSGGSESCTGATYTAMFLNAVINGHSSSYVFEFKFTQGTQCFTDLTFFSLVALESIFKYQLHASL